jgi:hypothetical protein
VTTNAFSASIIEKIKRRTDYADLYSFREDPWTPDMLLIDEKEVTDGIFESKVVNNKHMQYTINNLFLLVIY